MEGDQVVPAPHHMLLHVRRQFQFSSALKRILAVAVKISQVIYLSNLNIYSNFNLFLFVS